MIGGISGAAGIGGVGGMPGPMRAPNVGADPAGGGSSFADVMGDIVLKSPSESAHKADTLGAAFAAGANVDTHTLAIASAKAGVDIQMSTRVISQAASAVRQLFSIQI